MATRTRRIDGSVERVIDALARRGWGPRQIERKLQANPKLAQLAPSLRTIQRYVSDVVPDDPSGRWSLDVADDPGDTRPILDVLRGAGLVNTRSEGRRRINSLNVAPIRQILERWIHKYEAYWTNTLLRVKESAEIEATEKKSPKTKRA